jgi:hypothetical protein
VVLLQKHITHPPPFLPITTSPSPTDNHNNHNDPHNPNNPNRSTNPNNRNKPNTSSVRCGSCCPSVRTPGPSSDSPSTAEMLRTHTTRYQQHHHHYYPDVTHLHHQVATTPPPLLPIKYFSSLHTTTDDHLIARAGDGNTHEQQHAQYNARQQGHMEEVSRVGQDEDYYDADSRSHTAPHSTTQQHHTTPHHTTQHTTLRRW